MTFYLKDCKKFDPNKDNPEDYDKKNIEELARTYRVVLESVRNAIESEYALSAANKTKFVCKYMNWDSLAFQLIAGCTVAESLDIAPNSQLPFWLYYTKSRILPALLLNSLIGKAAQDGDTYSITLGSMYAIQYMWEGVRGLAETSQGANIVSVLAHYNVQVSCAVGNELSNRYSDLYLENPSKLLKEYRQGNSPLLRSSILETVAHVFCIMRGINSVSIGWVRKYEEIRQSFDDLVDLTNDIKKGRVTYPVLFALIDPTYGKKIKREIEKIWDKSRNQESVDSNITILKGYLIDSGVLKKVSDQVEWRLESVISEINNSDLPGPRDKLLCWLEVKRSALARMKINKWTGYRPVYSIW